MSKDHELKTVNILEEKLHLHFTNKKYKLDNWGEADDWAEIEDNIYVFIEDEFQQQHPNTNVLKLWPYLTINKEKCVFLIQVFSINSRSLKNSRGRLCDWTAREMKKQLKGRFDYYKLVIDDDDDDKYEEIREMINQFLQRRM